MPIFANSLAKIQNKSEHHYFIIRFFSERYLKCHQHPTKKTGKNISALTQSKKTGINNKGWTNGTRTHNDRTKTCSVTITPWSKLWFGCKVSNKLPNIQIFLAIFSCSHLCISLLLSPNQPLVGWNIFLSFAHTDAMSRRRCGYPPLARRTIPQCGPSCSGFARRRLRPSIRALWYIPAPPSSRSSDSRSG